jgi:hypothetical protein
MPGTSSGNLNFFRWARDKDHAIGLDALMLGTGQDAFSLSAMVSEHASKPKTRRTALMKAQFNKPALAVEHLHGKLPAIFAGREPLKAFEHRGNRAAIILELLGAVLNTNVSAPADVFVVGALVGILKPPPAAHVIDENHLEIETLEGTVRAGRGLQQNLRVAQNFRSMTAQEMQALRDRVQQYAADGRFELYKLSLKFDNPEARLAHQFLLDLQQVEVKEMVNSTGYPAPDEAVGRQGPSTVPKVTRRAVSLLPWKFLR